MKLRRKVRMSYVISTVSIAMVLFLLGSVSYLMLSVVNAADRVREEMAVYVMLKEEITPQRAAEVGDRLRSLEPVREVVFVSREQAAADFVAYSGDDFEEFLDYNPLPDSFEVKMHAEGSSYEAVQGMAGLLETWDEVGEVVYQRGVVEQLGTNINKFNLVLFVFGAILLLISIILLNNTIRITVYSKRFIIQTMKLVGATKWFVMKPFVRSSLLQGVYAALIAMVLLSGLMAGLGEGLPEIRFASEFRQMAWIAGGMAVGGIAISLLFTMLAVNKFINMRSNAVHLY